MHTVWCRATGPHRAAGEYENAADGSGDNIRRLFTGMRTKRGLKPATQRWEKVDDENKSATRFRSWARAWAGLTTRVWAAAAAASGSFPGRPAGVD